jgi:hypothetical protein
MALTINNRLGERLSMLARNSYPKAYIDECRASIDAQLAAYKALKLTSASAFERLFFNNLVVLLDRLFVHRTRGREVSFSPVKVRVSFPVKIEPRINLISLCRPAPFRFRNLFRLPQSPPAEPSRKITPDVSKGQQRYNVSYGSVSRAGLRRKLPCCSRRADGQKWAPS